MVDYDRVGEDSEGHGETEVVGRVQVEGTRDDLVEVDLDDVDFDVGVLFDEDSV